MGGPSSVAPMPTSTRTFFRKAWNSWATRSLAVGAVATAIDIAVGLGCLQLLRFSTGAAAMSGVAVGATFTFLANRFFAFKDHDPKQGSPALKFILITAVSMLVHREFVVLLRDHFHVPFVLAKMIADVGVFSVGQLLLLRYLVFPKAKSPVSATQLQPPRPSSGRLSFPGEQHRRELTGL